MQFSSLISKLDSIENSPRQSIFESIGRGDPYFNTWEKEIHPILCEVAMSPDQIQQLFKDVEKGAGRSGLGKAVDSVKSATDKVSDVWFNKFGGMLQSSGPVQAFDQKWEDIKSKVAAKNPELAAKLAKYGEFAKNNPKTHKFLLAIAGSAAAALGVAAAGGIGASALAVGTGAGVATGILNIADRLLKGEKASTAIGRGATTGLVAGLSAAAMAKIGQVASAMREKAIPFGTEDTGLEMISWKANREINTFGSQLKQMTQGFNVLVRPEEADAIRAAIKGVQAGDPGAFQTLMTIGKEVHSQSYKTGMQEIVAGAFDAAKANDSLLQWINGLTKAATAASGGAASAATAGGGDKKPVAESLTREQLNELFGFTGNKVDAGKLQKAWEKAGSPTDSDEVAKVLQSAGVDVELINSTFQSMGLPASSLSATATPDNKVNIEDTIKQIRQEFDKLSPADKKQVLAYLIPPTGKA